MLTLALPTTRLGDSRRTRPRRPTPSSVRTLPFDFFQERGPPGESLRPPIGGSVREAIALRLAARRKVAIEPLAPSSSWVCCPQTKLDIRGCRLQGLVGQISSPVEIDRPRRGFPPYLTLYKACNPEDYVSRTGQCDFITQESYEVEERQVKREEKGTREQRAHCDHHQICSHPAAFGPGIRRCKDSCSAGKGQPLKMITEFV
ncbi:hypothetical protein C4D60_Mb10t27100 [Musa balbisiana]|uniref:Uncharacterized protein n=1 Tax=Musa balbisiana TaxID=52838 RepID=A0A4S8J081_MUSBA|nr:hypothetical protein C4D60_Mb10t27100 [Musa balbisiana]